MLKLSRFVLPVSALLIAASAFADGLARRGAVGMAMGLVPAQVQKKDNLKAGEGVVVNSVLPGLTGEAAGVKVGDVLLSLNGKAVTPTTVGAMVRTISAGSNVEFRVLRDGSPMTLNAKLVEKPRDPGNENYSVEYSFVDTKAGRMRTMISHPKAPGKHPALMFIQGYSPISYDFNLSSTTGLDAPILFDFANSGFVTMRVEKPGVGDSEGGPFSGVDFTTELDIYRQALKQLKAQSEVDSGNVFIFGHSMGGAFGPMIATEIPVKGLAMYGIAARTWEEYLLDVLRYQALLAGTPYDQVDDGVRKGARVMELVFQDHKTPDQVSKEYPDLKATIAETFPGGLFNGKCAEFWGQLENTNFESYWSKVDSHVLSMHGESDFVSYKVDHQLVADIVNSKHPGWGKFVSLPSSDHLFDNYASEADSLKNFPNGTFNPACIKVLRDWVADVMAGH